MEILQEGHRDCLLHSKNSVRSSTFDGLFGCFLCTSDLDLLVLPGFLWQWHLIHFETLIGMQVMTQLSCYPTQEGITKDRRIEQTSPLRVLHWNLCSQQNWFEIVAYIHTITFFVNSQMVVNNSVKLTKNIINTNLDAISLHERGFVGDIVTTGDGSYWQEQKSMFVY